MVDDVLNFLFFLGDGVDSFLCIIGAKSENEEEDS